MTERELIENWIRAAESIRATCESLAEFDALIDTHRARLAAFKTTSWQFELDGEATDLLALRPLASACDCTIRPGPGDELWLSGARFDAISTSEEALQEAKKALLLLNGLARLENQRHGTVSLGNEFLQNGRKQYIKPPTGVRPLRSRVYISQPPVLGAEPVTGPPIDPAVARRRARIAADPKLAEILEALADEITWQRLRVAFEKIRALVGQGDNGLVRHGYATRPELTRFKANIEDPRHSGLDAVHGVPKGQFKGTKMTTSEGFDFVVRLFNKYWTDNLETVAVA
jgi:hypothetical protein